MPIKLSSKQSSRLFTSILKAVSTVVKDLDCLQWELLVDPQMVDVFKNGLIIFNNLIKGELVFDQTHATSACSEVVKIQKDDEV